MENINRRFSDKFRSHWVKVKFYKEKPSLKDVKSLKDIRFCEAAKEAILYPLLLDKKIISCPGAQYAFGWSADPKDKNELLNCCQDKSHTQRGILKSILSRVPYFKKPFNYIGLNTEGPPDLLMSYIMPEEAMSLIKLYHNHQAKNLDVSLCSMMSICGGVAVRTYLEGKMSFSFGCNDSRKYGQIGRDRLAVGIPKELFKIFTA